MGIINDPPSEDNVIAESNKAKLIQKGDGSVVCTCPYLCLATYEECEFVDHPLVIEQNKK